VKIARRREEGCLTVEMEAASLMAVAQFRGVSFGQILYAGDDLSGREWDNRDWQSRTDVREALFWAAADAALSLAKEKRKGRQGRLGGAPARHLRCYNVLLQLGANRFIVLMMALTQLLKCFAASITVSVFKPRNTIL
jgi:hypothetical protein